MKRYGIIKERRHIKLDANGNLDFDFYSKDFEVYYYSYLTKEKTINEMNKLVCDFMENWCRMVKFEIKKGKDKIILDVFPHETEKGKRIIGHRFIYRVCEIDFEE